MILLSLFSCCPIEWRFVSEKAFASMRSRFSLTIRTLHATGAVWIKDKGICNVRRDGTYVVVRTVNTCRHVLSISCKIKVHACSSRSRSTRKLFSRPEPLTSVTITVILESVARACIYLAGRTPTRFIRHRRSPRTPRVRQLSRLLKRECLNLIPRTRDSSRNRFTTGSQFTHPFHLRIIPTRTKGFLSPTLRPLSM